MADFEEGPKNSESIYDISGSIDLDKTIKADWKVDLAKAHEKNVRIYLSGAHHTVNDGLDDHRQLMGRAKRILIEEYGWNELHKSEVEIVQGTHRSRDLIARIVDLILEPDEAEGTIGDLEEGYARRYKEKGGHAVWWIWAQLVWISVNRSFDLIRRYARAKAGK